MGDDEVMVRIAEIEIDPHHLDAYNAMLAEEINASLALEPGVLFLHAVALQDSPNKVRVFECYASRKAYEHHITTPHFLNYKTATRQMVKSLRLLETNPIALTLSSSRRS